MTREKLEARLHRTADIIGTDYRPYLSWLKKDIKTVVGNLKIRYKAELFAHIKLHSNKDVYDEMERKFYGAGSAGLTLSKRDWGEYNNRRQEYGIN